MPPPAPLQSFPRRPGEGAGKAAEAEEELRQQLEAKAKRRPRAGSAYLS